MANEVSKIKFGSTTYELRDASITNKAAASGGTDNTLVTTGDKYKWNAMSTTSYYKKYDSTTIAAVRSDLDATFGSKYCVAFTMYQPTDGHPSGMYLAVKDGTLSSYARIIFLGNDTTGISSASLMASGNASGNSLPNINGADLHGYYLGKGDQTTGLPSTGDQWWACLLCGRVQIAAHYTSDAVALDTVCIRSYVNSSWTPWVNVVDYKKHIYERLIPNNAKTIKTTLTYTGVSFTLSSPALVIVTQNYENAFPQQVALSTSSSSVSNGALRSFSSGTDPCPALVAPLDAGTYYIWAKAATEGTNTITCFRFD